MTVQITRGELILDSVVVNQSFSTVFNGYCLVVDTETFTDIQQRARIAMYCLFDLKKASLNPNNIEYKSKGIVVYDLTDNELSVLKQYCKDNNLMLLDKETFINKLLFPCLTNGTVLVGHNIPFDIGSLCFDFSIIPDKKMFRFKLCTCGETNDIVHTHTKITVPCNIHPTIVIQNVKSKRYVMYVEQNNSSPIVDTITLGNALLGAGASSLDKMVKRYGHTDKHKKKVESYSTEYDINFYDYSMHDVYLTSILIASQYQLYKRHDISKPFYTIMSEASVGKAYNEKLGIPPFKEGHKEVSPFMYTLANIAYYGARSEVHKRLQPAKIFYCDFKSQYPLVNSLLDSQRYILAEYVRIQHCVNEAQDLIDNITLDELQHKETWKILPMLVKVRTNNDILPCKVVIQGKSIFGTQILNNTISWYSMLDIVASKIRTSKTVEILDAYKLIPQGSIKTNEIDVLGNSNYHVDLSKDDFFIKVIDLRDSVKTELKQVKKQISINPTEELYQQKNFFENLQLALKLMANSTAYGMLVETREIERVDIAGRYNAQPIGIHITSGGRLLLAIAEKLGIDRGIYHAFCDTDSFAYTQPNTMSNDDFNIKVSECINWFNSLSPYESKSAIFELEEYNYLNGELKDLYALCISAKRYVLYNKLDNGKYLIRKLSEHGVIPYNTNFEIALPDDMIDIEQDELGVRKHRAERYALWYRGIEQVEKGEIPTIPIEKWSQQLALTRVTISTPRVYEYFSYIPNLRPFSFFVVSPKSRFKDRKDRYYMPFIQHSGLIQQLLKEGKVRKVKTNEVATDINSIDTIRERLIDFYSHTESKSENGNEIGTMKRRVIDSTTVEERLRSGKKIQDTNQLKLWW